MIDVMISEIEIKKRIQELGAQISKDYQGKELILVGVLKGSLLFMADLMREIKNVDVKIDFLMASSYGEHTTSSGNVKILKDTDIDLEGKHVLLIEDIVDTGNTIHALMHIFKARNLASIKLASLLFKPARLLNKVDIDYLGFTIEDKFVIGYGLDFDQKYRELPYIGVYKA